MKNKNLLIGVGVAVLVYYLYNQNQKKKLQATPYTDSELDKIANDFVTEERKRALEVNPSGNVEDIDKAKRSIVDLIQRAKNNGKDVSRVNVDKMLNIFRKMQRSQIGDNSAGTATPEEESILYDFIGMNKPLVESNTPSSPIGEKKDLGNGLSVVYDIANCNKTTKKCPIMRVIKQDGDTFTSWYSENNKYFKRVESLLAPKGGNVTEITEQQYIDEAISKVPF
jgi:hypothetical protein